MSINTTLAKWDILSFSCYKYVGVITVLVIGGYSSLTYYLALAYVSSALFFFLLRTLRLRIEPEVSINKISSCYVWTNWCISPDQILEMAYHLFIYRFMAWRCMVKENFTWCFCMLDFNLFLFGGLRLGMYHYTLEPKIVMVKHHRLRRCKSVDKDPFVILYWKDKYNIHNLT